MSRARATRLGGLMVLLCVVSVGALYLRALQPQPAFEPALDLRDAVFLPLPHTEADRTLPVWVLSGEEPSAHPTQTPYLAEILRMAGFSTTLQPCEALETALETALEPPAAPALLVVDTSSTCAAALAPATLTRYVQQGGALCVVGVSASFWNAHQTLLGGTESSSTAQISAQTPAEAAPSLPTTALGPSPAAPPFLPRLPALEREFPLFEPFPLAQGGARVRYQALDEAGAPQARVFEHAVGAGNVLIWAFPLAEVVRETRQGRVDFTSSSGMAVPVSADAVQHAVLPASFDQPVLDQLMHQLTLSLEALHTPLPTFWPFLTETSASLIMTADQDFAPWSFVQFQVDEVEKAKGELSLYLTGTTRRQARDPLGAAQPDPEVLDQIPAWQDMHHGISVHPNANGLPRMREPLRETVASALQQLETCCGVRGRTLRHHFLFWWPEAAEDLAQLGILLELNLVSIRPGVSSPGFITGSGLPMPFVTPEGRVLPIFQQPTQVEDDVLLSTMSYSAQLSAVEATQRSQALLENAPRWGTAVTANIHPLYAAKTPELLRGLLSTAQRLQLPIVSAERWLDLHLRRQQAHLHTLKKTAQGLEGILEVSRGPLWLRIPIQPDILTKDPAQLNGQPVAWHVLPPDGPLPGVLIQVPTGQHKLRLPLISAHP
ncbi:MAG: hypothetical protein ACKO6N_08865 [Myxococcota bacterium]